MLVCLLRVCVRCEAAALIKEAQHCLEEGVNMKSTATSARGGSWMTVALCALVVVAEGYDLIVFGALIPSLLAEPGWGLGPAEVGTVGSLVYVGMLGGALASGRLSDRFGRRRLVLVSIAVFTVFTVGCAIAQNPWELGAFRLLAGMGMGGVMPSVVSLAKEHAPAGKINMVVTILMAGVPFGGTAASLLGLVVIPKCGWRAMFAIGVVVAVIIFAVAWKLLPESEEFSQNRLEGGRGRFADLFSSRFARLTILFGVAAFANLLTWYGLNTWLTQLMESMDYPLSSALQFSLTLNVGAVVGSFLLAYLADRFGSLPVAAVSGLCTALAIAGAALGAPSQILLLAFIAVMGMGAHTALNLINAAVADGYPTWLRATALGWSNGIGRLGAIVSPWLGGVIVGAGMSPHSVFWAFVLSSVASVIAVVLLVGASRGRAGEDVPELTNCRSPKN
jgi:AAHS family benzoate transporter-like MFS transporter